MKLLYRMIPWQCRILLVQEYIIFPILPKNYFLKFSLLTHRFFFFFLLTSISTHWWTLQSLENVILNSLWNGYKLLALPINWKYGCDKEKTRDYLWPLTEGGMLSCCLPESAKCSSWHFTHRFFSIAWNEAEHNKQLKFYLNYKNNCKQNFSIWILQNSDYVWDFLDKGAS